MLSCWSLNESSREKNAVASLLMEDIALSVTLVEGSDNITSLAAITRSGVVHVYQHTLNGLVFIICLLVFVCNVCLLL